MINQLLLCAKIIPNSTNHFATLPTGHIGYNEVPNTNEKPNYYQVNDINTLIHNVTHTYHPEITELVPQTNYFLQYNDNTDPSHQFSLHQVYMTNSDTPPITSIIYNVLLALQNLEFSLHYHTLQKISKL